jgi:hypothetical protein
VKSSRAGPSWPPERPRLPGPGRAPAPAEAAHRLPEQVEAHRDPPAAQGVPERVQSRARSLEDRHPRRPLPARHLAHARDALRPLRGLRVAPPPLRQPATTSALGRDADGPATSSRRHRAVERGPVRLSSRRRPTSTPSRSLCRPISGFPGSTLAECGHHFRDYSRSGPSWPTCQLSWLRQSGITLGPGFAVRALYRRQSWITLGPGFGR